MIADEIAALLHVDCPGARSVIVVSREQAASSAPHRLIVTRIAMRGALCHEKIARA
jgi:hypothetical protein